MALFLSFFLLITVASKNCNLLRQVNARGLLAVYLAVNVAFDCAIWSELGRNSDDFFNSLFRHAQVRSYVSVYREES
jgi:hypothetical protein